VSRPAPAYNVVVLGGGTAGLVTAAAVAGLGGRVVLVERDRMGGDCLNTGCVPSKALISSARLLDRIRRSEEWGIPRQDPQVAFERVFARVRERRARIAPKDSQERFESLGVEVLRGEARFVSPREVRVGARMLRAANFVIATGSRPAVPAVPGLSEVPFHTNETIFDLDSLPGRLAVIGGGPIACELGQAFARLGTVVTILQRGPQILEKEDADVAAALSRRLESEGIRVRVSVNVERVERVERAEASKGGVRVRLLSAGGAADAVACDAILVAAGRRPNVEDLDLAAAGVAFTPRGVTVDSRMRTSQRHIYAAGDVVGKQTFTHAADAHARIVVRNILLPAFPAALDESAIPWCPSTDPEVARVGLSETQARDRSIPYDLWQERFDDVDRAVVESEDRGFARVLTEKGGDRILGAVIVSERAGDVLPELVLAMKAGLGLSKISGTVHSYPTFGEMARKLADRQQKSRLTPLAKRVFSGLFAWRLRRLGS
jgi:pyruvate/2-oxoglutarate dehydrogenase complex dihydrolipoamide dehydrogenase (E3) component